MNEEKLEKAKTKLLIAGGECRVGALFSSDTQKNFTEIENILGEIYELLETIDE